MTTTFAKDPDATMRIEVEWADRIPSGATLSTATWAASPSGLTLSGSSTGTTAASTLVAGGMPGHTYRLTCQATLSDSQVLEQDVHVYITPR